MKNHHNKKKGFTLIELVIVIAILGILASIAVPKYGGIQQKAKKQADVTNAKVIANAFSILIAQGTVTGDVTGDTDEDPCKSHLENYLQAIPTQQVSNYVGQPFYVEVNMPEAEIEIYTESGTGRIMLYPAVDASYKD